MSKKTFSELLDEAIRLSKELDEMVSKVYPGVQTPSLEGLTLDQKMALGEENCRQLRQLTYQIAPEIALDGIEQDLPTDVASQELACHAIRSMQSQKSS